ncbi:Wzy polymerase domain-containing protein [Spongiibacter tropicus]|uniref:Wzy polymerase domain-containing protein n=1 Tax=Spongiibacter tropicus TaxID=454602 RepID=UPI0023567D32|nr:Wzy polymerase domain-containing protein [Spongiibacter tropicus]
MKNSLFAVPKATFIALVFLAAALAWLLPNHYFPWVTAYQEFLMFLAAIGFYALVVFISRDGLYFPILSVFFLVVAVIPLLQWYADVIFFFGDALVAAIYLAAFGLCVSAGYSFCRARGDSYQLVSVFFFVVSLSAGISVWIALRQWLQLSGSIWVADLMPGGRPYANFAQPNNFASFLVAALLGIAYFFERGRIGRLSAGLVTVFLLVGLALTQSRTPLAIMCVLIPAWFWLSRRVFLRLRVIWVLGFFALYLILFWLLPFLSEWLLLPEASGLERLSGGAHRLDIWWQLLLAVKDASLWGYGWNQVSVAQVYASQLHYAPFLVEHSHNIVLDVLLWNGAILGGLLVVFFALWFLRVFFLIKSIEGFFAFLVVCVFVVHGCFEYPLEYAYFLLPLGVIAGVAIYNVGNVCVVPVSRFLGCCVLVFSVFGFVLIYREYSLLHSDSLEMRFEASGIGERNGSPPPEVLMLTQLSSFIEFARMQAEPGMTADELEFMRKVAVRYPFPPCLFRYGLALALNGRIGDAREQMLILKSLHAPENYTEARNGLEIMSEKYPELTGLIDVLPLPDAELSE